MKSRPPLFRKRQFAAEIIITCVRWYLRFSLSLRDIEELMAERGLTVDHTTIWRWIQSYAPEIQRRLHGQLKPKGSTWHMDALVLPRINHPSSVSFIRVATLPNMTIINAKTAIPSA
jgi:transposase-like protein